MNAAQVNTLGGVCELLGVVAVVWGLVDVAAYRGVPARIRAWLGAGRAAIVAEVRRVLHRPRQVALLDVGTATMHMTANQAAVLTREPFTSRPGQSLEDQIAELGALVNRLQADLLAQDQKHDQAIDTLRQQTYEKIQAEHQRADAALKVVREELERLREATTGGLHLEIDGVLGVLVGVIFTTWPDAVASWLLGWVPPFRALITGFWGYPLERTCPGRRPRRAGTRWAHLPRSSAIGSPLPCHLLRSDGYPPDALSRHRHKASAVMTRPVRSTCSSSGRNPLISLLLASTRRCASTVPVSWSSAASRCTGRLSSTVEPRSVFPSTATATTGRSAPAASIGGVGAGGPLGAGLPPAAVSSAAGLLL